VIDPLFFVPCIKNLVEFCRRVGRRKDLFIYADDAKLFSDDISNLQNALNNINTSDSQIWLLG